MDEDGSLQIHTEDWEGGLNALRRDMEEMSLMNKQNYEKTIARLKTDLDSDITTLKEEVLSLLGSISEDVKSLRAAQTQKLLPFDAHHNIAKVVRAAQSVGRKREGENQSKAGEAFNWKSV